jgi:DNA-binding response OmpR family regulator
LTAGLRFSVDAHAAAADLLVAPLSVLTEILACVDCPILIGYGAEADMARALACGCRDYLCEPWGYDQMVLRCLRCLHAGDQPLVSGRLKLTSTFLECGDRKAPISRHEYRIAEILLNTAGLAVPRESFNRALWGLPDRAGRSLDIHISSLRGKIRAINGGVDGIRTCRGYGYMYVGCE